MLHPSTVVRFDKERLAAPTTQIFANSKKAVEEYRRRRAILCVSARDIENFIGDKIKDFDNFPGATLMIDTRCGQLNESSQLVYTTESTKYYDSVRVLALSKAADSLWAVLARNVLERNYEDVNPAFIIVKFADSYAIVAAGDGIGTRRMTMELYSFRSMRFDIIDIVPSAADTDYVLTRFIKQSPKYVNYITQGIIEIRHQNLDEIMKTLAESIDYIRRVFP